MSEVHSNEVIADVAPEVEASGQPQEVTDVVESLSEAEIELLPVDEFGDKYVSVQVNGEDVKVPLKEALSGYQRQADYTRKTQELSEQRRQVQFGAALQEALQSDPEKTLELLSQHYGINKSISAEEELDLDPVEKQYRHLEQRVQAFEQQKAMEELDRTVETLQNRYGTDFDANEVVSKALAIGSTDLEAVYKQMKFDSIYEDAQAIRQIRAKKAQETEQITQAKRDSGVVSGGASSVSADVSVKPITSLRDAFEAAKRQLNG
jgi:predicted metal-dependent hydrolase